MDNLINEYIEIKRKYQELFYKYEKLKLKTKKIESENASLRIKIQSLTSNISRENNRLIAKVSQLNRLSVSTSTPKITKIVTPKKKCSKKNIEKVFEVKNIVGHRGRKGNRQYLIHWKGYTNKDNTWEKETNLSSCPEILEEYKKKKRLAH